VNWWRQTQLRRDELGVPDVAKAFSAGFVLLAKVLEDGGEA
jgi:hypothetical protein